MVRDGKNLKGGALGKAPHRRFKAIEARTAIAR